MFWLLLDHPASVPMKQKLTLRLDRSVIQRVKAYAQERGTSVSQLAAAYFEALTRKEASEGRQGRPGRDYPLPSAVQELVGIAEGDEKDYYDHVVEKHQ